MRAKAAAGAQINCQFWYQGTRLVGRMAGTAKGASAAACCARKTTCRQRLHRRCGQNLRALRLGQRLLRKGVQALGVGMKSNWGVGFIVQPSLGTRPIENIAVDFFKFISRSRGSAPSASWAARLLRPEPSKIPENLLAETVWRAAACGSPWLHERGAPWRSQQGSLIQIVGGQQKAILGRQLRSALSSAFSRCSSSAGWSAAAARGWLPERRDRRAAASRWLRR